MKPDLWFASLGAAATFNPVWMSFLPDIWQIALSLMGGVALFYVILKTRAEWKLNKKKLEKLNETT